MQQKNFLRISLVLLLAACLGLFTRCSKDDSPSDNGEDEVLNGGIIKTYEVVMLEHNDITQDIYQGTFNGNAIEIGSDTENHLVFIVLPEMVTEGEDNLLEIPSLGLKVSYQVQATVLQATAQETLEPFIEGLNNTDSGNFEQRDKVEDFINSFNLYYASLSDNEKEDMAKYYLANNDLFDGVFTTAGRNKNLLGLSQCQSAKLKMAVLGVMAVGLANPGTMPLSILSAAGAVVSFKNAVNYCTDFMSQKIKQSFLMFNDVVSSREGVGERSANSVLAFNSGELQSFSVLNGMRGIQASDASDVNQEIANFFSYVTDINDFIINKLNIVIAAYNDFAPSYFAIEPFDQAITVPQSSDAEEQEITQEIFSNFSFSTGNNEVQISAINYNNGNIDVVLAITDPQMEEVTTTLNYTYSDAYNNRQGSFNITVSQEVADCSGFAVTAIAESNSATATATGGQPPYMYEWSNGDTGASMTGLEEGEYTVTATDVNGCTASETVVVEAVSNILEGTWNMDITLGAGGCDETLIMDETNALLQFVFNENQTITFLNDPAGMDLNTGYYNQVYQWVEEEQYLEISINYYDFENNENIYFEIHANYNENNETFSGTYTNIWSDGDGCQNSVSIFK